MINKLMLLIYFFIFIFYFFLFIIMHNILFNFFYVCGMMDKKIYKNLDCLIIM